MSYKGERPDGKRFYVQSKTGAALAFAVFARRGHKRWNIERADYDVLGPFERWEKVDLIEDRTYENERHRVNGSYVPYPGPMPAAVRAEEKARWYREVIGGYEAVVVPLVPADGRPMPEPERAPCRACDEIAAVGLELATGGHGNHTCGGAS